jgi:ABC-type thiamin/hydroxymethylpyrimidine transport system permease subunit
MQAFIFLVMELFMAVMAAGVTPEMTGLRKVTVQLYSGAWEVTVVLDTVGVTETGVALAAAVASADASAVASADGVADSAADVGLAIEVSDGVAAAGVPVAPGEDVGSVV